VKVEPDGRFTVISRGGNVAIHIWSRSDLSPDQIGSLRDRFSRLGGIAEVPRRAKFAVVTVPVASGFPAIEEAIKDWVDAQEAVEWYYGNVYDADDRPLNWWAADAPPAPPTGFDPVPPP
jgi:Domain of unknown function (DUF4265)